MNSTPPTPGERNTEFRELVDVFRETLLSAAAQRQAREHVLPSGEFAWVLFERLTMHAAVNALRADRGLPAVPVEDVERAERQAVGHSDYVAQFAYGCARLVQGASLAENGPAPLP